MNINRKNNGWHERSAHSPKARYYSENPWDGSGKVKAQVIESRYTLKTVLFFTLIITLSILLFAAGSRGEGAEKESPVPAADAKKTTPKAKKDAKAPQDRKIAEIAEEYAYLLEQLLYLSTDYCRYFEKLDDKAAAENYQALANMCSRISKNEQFENVNDILAEIENLKKELVLREKDLTRMQADLEKQSSEIRRAQSNLKSLKLTSSLREELESLDEQLERDIVWKIEKNSYSPEAVQAYVKTIVNDSLIQFVGNLAEAYAPGLRVFTDKDGNSRAVIVEVAPTPETNPNSIPDVPAGTSVPHVHPMPEMPPIGHFTGVSYSREFKDSLLLKSASIAVNISNAIGSVIISPSVNNYLTTSYTIAIASEDPENSKSFGEEIQLRLYPKADRVYVESIVPSLDDPATRIAESRLEVYVPKNNPVSISNTSGKVSVNDLTNNIKVNSASSNVDIYRHNGNVELVNSSGNVSVGKVDGSVNLQNRMGPITLFRCEGPITIDNSFGQVSMEDCQGDATIRNTGPITVENHTGGVEINNRNGLITIENVKGNLVVFNSFEKIVLNNINGAAKIVNANAPVLLEEITGMVTVNNRFGNITGIALNGPLTMENKNGNIILDLSKPLLGNSSVISNGGNVMMTVADRSNLLLNLESVGGDILIGGFNSKVDDNNAGIKTAKLSLGKSAGTLAIKTTGSNITLNRAE